MTDPAVFDWQAYLAINNSLVTTDGLRTQAQAQNDWLQNGIAQGLQGNGSFSVQSYLSQHNDVAVACGTSGYLAYQCAIQHYLCYGQPCGYTGYPSSPTYGATLLDPNSTAGGTNTGDAVVGSYFIQVSTSTKDAGAISRVMFGGQNLVNDAEHGAQWQTAAFVNWDTHGCDNPTEAGSWMDRWRTTSSSALGSISATTSGVLTTYQNPAFWFNRSDPSGAAAGCTASGTQPWQSTGLPPWNDGSLSPYDTNFVFSKQVEMNVAGDPQIFKVYEGINIASGFLDVQLRPMFAYGSYTDSDSNPLLNQAGTWGPNTGFSAVTSGTVAGEAWFYSWSPGSSDSGSPQAIFMSRGDNNYVVAMVASDLSLNGSPVAPLLYVISHVDPADVPSAGYQIVTAYHLAAPIATGTIATGTYVSYVYFVIGITSQDVSGKLSQYFRKCAPPRFERQEAFGRVYANTGAWCSGAGELDAGSPRSCSRSSLQWDQSPAPCARGYLSAGFTSEPLACGREL